MATETFSQTQQRSLLNQGINLSGIRWEAAAYLVVIILSIIAHLWGLGTMAMHHDESIHAWASWRFYTGEGGFTCAGHDPANNIVRESQTYCYDPVYHGPSLYFLTVASFFLFGDGDAQARLPMALAGIGLVASCWMLRPYLGRRGALIAAVLLGFSPALLYFTRFARHDGLMVLWELWLLIGMMRYLDTGKAGYLYLLAASLALAVGTHELYYIVFFIFGILVLTRLVFESAYAHYMNRGFAIILGLSLIFIFINPPLPIGQGLYLGEKMALVAWTILMTWLASRVWSPQPVLIPRLVRLWQEERRTLWVALGILVSLYLVMYTTFFTYPRGAIDGMYAGLAYWLGSQQEFARGDQPWYYYLMLLGIYEPLALLCSIGAALFLFGRGFSSAMASAPRLIGRSTDKDSGSADEEPTSRTAGRKQPDSQIVTPPTGRKRRRSSQPQPVQQPQPAPAASAQAAPADLPTGNLFPLVIVVWFLSALVIFSWAGEKMPWLVTHMALPGNLVAAWALAQLLRVLPSLRDGDTGDWHPWRMLLVPPALLLMLVALGVALWKFYAGGAGQEAQINLLQGIIPLVIFGLMIYALLTLGQQFGLRITFSLIGLTLAALLGVYMIRATWLVVYEHPDVAIEPLIYTQTAPDVPLYVERMNELAVNLTRNHRNSEDVTGGLSMPLVLSNGDESGDGSLAWPLQWYFRHYQNLVWLSADQIRNADPATFEVDLPDGTRGLAPALMLFRPHVTEATRNFLSEHYVQPYGESAVFNWWFPEGDKCNPDEPGYKRFYYSVFTPRSTIEDFAPPHGQGCVPSTATQAEAQQLVNEIMSQLSYPSAPLLWPLLPQNIGDTIDFMLFRELPEGLRPGSRDMSVWLRSDLVSGGGETSTADTGSTTLRLMADQAFDESGRLNGPTGIAVDSRGRVYVADTQNHRIQVFTQSGVLTRTIGTMGGGEGQFYEPRGLAVDASDNLYVADTWNARVVKLGPDGEWLATWGSGSTDMGDGRRATITEGTRESNEQNPLGFFGPRAVAVDAAGRVYIADTGNNRVVVTDSQGSYLYQWGSEGSAPGSFSEPTSLALDAAGRVYVADTWNRRVQVFEQGPEGIAAPLPLVTWDVRGWEAGSYDDPFIAVTPAGQVYVSVPARQQMLAANPVGDVALRWGGSGLDMASLSSPSGIAVDAEGRVYVVDREAGRVLRFNLPPVLPQ